MADSTDCGPGKAHRLSPDDEAPAQSLRLRSEHRSSRLEPAQKAAVLAIMQGGITANLGRMRNIERSFRVSCGQKNHEPYFTPKHGDGWLISRQPCVLLQRTTAKEQTRRLIAAELPRRFLSEHGAVVIENHLNMIRPTNGSPAVSPNVLSAFLNTEIVDRAFRCLSGSVAVSAYELEALPLPPPDARAPLAELVKQGAGRPAIEDACAHLFALSDIA